MNEKAKERDRRKYIIREMILKGTLNENHTFNMKQ